MAYATVREVIGRAATQLKIVAYTPTQIAAFDPFASAEANIIYLIEYLRSLGAELSEKLKAHLHKEGTITTAASALSYSLPADYREMVDQSIWDRTNIRSLSGPVSAQYEQYLRAWDGDAEISIPYRIQGPALNFPIAPPDGLNIRYAYVSTYWVQSNGQAAGDKAAPTAANDTVLFDDLLVVLGLVLKFKQASGEDTSVAAHEFNSRLEYAAGMNESGPTLSLEGPRNGGDRFLDNSNLPDTGYA